MNQKVARTTLEKLGFDVAVANDGHAAVNAWKSGRFDLILMDCQMPNLDGYAATEEIRRLEQAGQRTPIIALTAHAMKGDDIKWLAAGMDDYLTKPLDRAKLLATLDRHLNNAARRSQHVSKAAPDGNTMTHNSPVDWSALVEATDGDQEMTRELVDLFVASGDEALAAIAAALSQRNYNAVKDHAHAVKGASANLYAYGANAAAARLEEAARSGAGDRLSALAADLRSETTQSIDYMRQKIAR